MDKGVFKSIGFIIIYIWQGQLVRSQHPSKKGSTHRFQGKAACHTTGPHREAAEWSGGRGAEGVVWARTFPVFLTKEQAQQGKKA